MLLNIFAKKTVFVLNDNLQKHDLQSWESVVPKRKDIKWIHSATKKYAIPEVILLKTFDRLIKLPNR